MCSTLMHRLVALRAHTLAAVLPRCTKLSALVLNDVARGPEFHAIESDGASPPGGAATSSGEGVGTLIVESLLIAGAPSLAE